MAEDFTAWVFALAAIPLFVVLVARYPATFLAALVPSQILLGGMERGALVPGLRPGELVLGLSLAGLVLSPRWRFHRAVRGPLNSWFTVATLAQMAAGGGHRATTHHRSTRAAWSLQ